MTTIHDTAAPGWARGTFIWKLSLADRADALVEVAERITALA